MMKLWASVMEPSEAETARQGGADLVDLCDPTGATLNPVSVEMLERTLSALKGRLPVATSAGVLPLEDLASVVRGAGERRAADFIKIGFYPSDRSDRLSTVEKLADLARETALIAVFFADGDPDPSFLPLLAQSGFCGVMIDTIGPSSGGLLSHMPTGKLSDFLAGARHLGLVTAVSGALEAPDIPRLAVLSPDYLAFRGALTAGDRTSPIELDSVRQIKRLMDAAAPPPSASARSMTIEPVNRVDRIFVTGLTLELRIGAYGHERDRRQKVRFSVEADIEPIGDDARTMADIYSYDVITDEIRAFADRDHVDLVETLALDLANRLLADLRIRCVTVRVEKLELGADAVGIEITRRRVGG